MDFNEKQYVGINALVGLTLAEYEKCGIGSIIDAAVGDKGKNRTLPIRSVVKMIAGAMMTPFDRIPLYRFDKMYGSAPVDLLFGEGLTPQSLNARSISRALDIISALDMSDILWRCALSCNAAYGLSSDTYHVDATNFSVYALTEDTTEDDFPKAMFGGNSKTGRNDLRQYNAMSVTDSNRVLRYLRAYSGNTSDVTMDRDAIDFLRHNIDPKVSTVVADCKIVTQDMIRDLIGMGMGFISKCPANFSDSVRDSIIDSVGNSFLDKSSLGDGYGVYDTDADTVCGRLRFIAYKTPHDREDGIRFLTEDGERRLIRAFSRFRTKEFECFADADRAFCDALSELKDTAYQVSCEIHENERTERRPHRGRPSKDSEPPKTVRFWKVSVSWEFDLKKAESMIADNDIQIIVTNIPRGTDGNGNLRDGASADTVVRTYLDEYKAEHTFRLLKSGIGMDKVFLHKGNRVAAMIFIAGIAGVLSSTMDAVLRRGNADTTTHLMKLDLADTTVRLKRQTGYTYIDGHEGAGAEIQEYCCILDIDPDSMIGIH